MELRMIAAGALVAFAYLQPVAPIWAADPTGLRGAASDMPPALLAQYAKYCDAIRHHDRPAILTVLAPGFTCTDGNNTVGLPHSFRKLWPPGMRTAFLGSNFMVESISVRRDRATAFVEQSEALPIASPGNMSGANPAEGVTVTYYWSQYWLKIGKAWKLSSMSRDRRRNS